MELRQISKDIHGCILRLLDLTTVGSVLLVNKYWAILITTHVPYKYYRSLYDHMTINYYEVMARTILYVCQSDNHLHLLYIMNKITDRIIGYTVAYTYADDNLSTAIQALHDKIIRYNQ